MFMNVETEITIEDILTVTVGVWAFMVLILTIKCQFDSKKPCDCPYEF